MVIRILWEEGVPILAGTDSDNPYAFPAFSLHDELALFVEFGMTPIDALRTATINAVKYLKTIDSLGTIAKGKRADVVILNGNPLQDISNTKNIHAVISNGQIYHSKDLEALKAEVTKMNANYK
jgi:imidazolonepropionase-like amidohydrolase